jgi:hypothetical protein
MKHLLILLLLGRVCFAANITNFYGGQDAFGAGDIISAVPSAPAALGFTSIIPYSCNAGAVYNGNLAGSGFTLSGINAIKGDDGAGHVFNLNVTISTDVLIYLSYGPGAFSPAAIYTLYYSTDSGSTWTNTSLTITSD